MNASSTAAPVYSDYADDADFRDLLEEFAASMRERVTELDAALQRHDFECIRGLAHQIKGAGGGYGFAGLSDRAQELEQSAKQQNLEAANTAFHELAAFVNRIRV